MHTPEIWEDQEPEGKGEDHSLIRPCWQVHSCVLALTHTCMYVCACVHTHVLWHTNKINTNKSNLDSRNPLPKDNGGSWAHP